MEVCNRRESDGAEREASEAYLIVVRSGREGGRCTCEAAGGREGVVRHHSEIAGGREGGIRAPCEVAKGGRYK